MSTIPASLFVSVQPSVAAAAGDGIDVNGLVLTESVRVPIGAVYSFASAAAVSSFFGPNSGEAVIAGGGTNKGSGYFGGFTGSTQLPGAILYTQYNANPVAAYLWGGNAGAALTLAQLQALTGSLTVVMDGYNHVISSISLASYNSFTAAATAIGAAFTDPTEASFTASIGSGFTASGSGTNLTVSAVAYGIISIGDTVTGTGIPSGTTIVSQTSGTTGGTGVYVTSQATTASTASCDSLSTVLNVTIDTDDAIAVGQTILGSSVAAGTVITALLTGTGGVGTYRISGAQQNVLPPESMTGTATAPVVTYDSQSQAFVVTSGITGAPSTAAFATGTLAAPLLLTSATGAVLSQGAAATTPAAFMTAVTQLTTNWVTFMTGFDPDGGSGNTIKQAFAAWNTAQNQRYCYVCWDTDVTPAASVPATGSLGYILKQNGNSGTCLISETSDLNLAAFVCGAAASINFNQTNGRTTFAFRNQSGLVASVTTGTAAINLGGNPQVQGSFGNGYNYFGAVGSGNANFSWFQRGTVTGPYQWLDSYINQIVLDNNLQVALLSFFGSIGSVPFNFAGASLISQALAPVISQFGDPAKGGFGAFAPGPLSAAQIAEVNNAAGINIAGTLQGQGWYLLVNQAPTSVRQSRGPWQIVFYYLDRGSVQSINLSSIAVT